ncbi:MAG: outer membrane protein assembly factor BamA [Myxococcaceae bacterium]
MKFARIFGLFALVTVLATAGDAHAQRKRPGGKRTGAAAPAKSAPEAPAPTPDLVPEPPPEEPTSDVPVADSSRAIERIAEIRVEGNRRVEAEAVKRALRNREGQLFDSSKTAEDLRALWALNYFQDVQLLVQRRGEKGLVYVIRVSERPSIHEVKLSGNEELSKDDFKDTLDIKTYSILDLDAVRRNAKKVQEKYVEKGFFLAEVTHKIEPVPGSTSVDVVFVIREHSKVMVKEIHFIGAQQVPQEELKAVMATKEGGHLSFLSGEGTYREEIFQRDLAVIQAAYYDRGFINVKVDKPQVSISPDKRFIYITLHIEEGEPYNIGRLDVSGDLLSSKQVLIDKMSSRAGELFNRSKLSKDILALTDVYYDEGYAYANITPVTQVNPEKKLIDLTFDIQKGKRVYIERIDLVGNTKTRDKVIRREMRVYEGELFSGVGMRKSKERVTALGFFETVEVTHKPGTDDTHVVVQVELKEKATGTFQVGMGFSNVENFIFTAQISQNNFLGWGQSVSASAQLSSLRQFLQLSWYDPYFLDTQFILSADFYRMQADYQGFIRDALGGNVNLGRHIFEDMMMNLTYTREYVTVETGTTSTSQNISYANLARSGVTSSFRLSWTWDRRDNRLFPSNGFMHFASVEVAPPILGGSFIFARYTGYTRWYWPLFWGIVFKTNANIGYIQQLDNGNPLPISEMYYLGGINTVRGYFLRSISPYTAVPLSSEPGAGISDSYAPFNVGGDKQLILNVELEFPIFEKVGIRGVIFYDAGNTWARNEQFFQDKQDRLPLGVFHSIGFGFRWFSPIGPLRFEWGIPLNKRPNDQPILFEFTIGNFF